MTIPDLFNKPKHTVWQDPVPIVDNFATKSMDIYLTDEIGVPFNYNELTYCIKNAPADYDIRLHISTPGGVIDGALFIVDAINKTPATVTAFLTGTVASAGTIIALACDNVVASAHLSFMIHNYSGILQGKGSEMKAHQEFVDKNLNNAFTDYYEGFLTTQEIESVIDGKDIWLGTEEVKERWENRKQARGL